MAFASDFRRVLSNGLTRNSLLSQVRENSALTAPRLFISVGVESVHLDYGHQSGISKKIGKSVCVGILFSHVLPYVASLYFARPLLHSLDEIPSKGMQRYFNDSSDDDFIPSSTTTTNNNNNHFSSSDRKPDNYSDEDDDGDEDGNDDKSCKQPLQEFIASGGGNGIFKVPVHAAEHPGRPPNLELRPHPLREMQIGLFLRTIVCTENHLWACQECGIRLWSFDDYYSVGCGIVASSGEKTKKGDEDAAPFHQSAQTSSALCLVVDSGNKLIWSGHKDGKIRSWKMDQPLDGTPFKEGLTWNVHHGHVLSLIMTSFGDMWSGSEGGVVKAWPWEPIEKSLSLKAEERHMVDLLVDTSEEWAF